MVFLSAAVSFLGLLTSEVIRSKKHGGLVFDIYGFKPWTRHACLKLADIINAAFCEPLYLSQREQGFKSTNFMISLLWPSEVRGPRALLRFEINCINDLPRGKKQQSLAVCKSCEEKECSSWRNTNQQLSADRAAGFDPSPEPLLNRLAALPDDGEWDAVVGPQTVGLGLFPCHFLWTVWVNTLTLVSPVCGDIWLALTGATTARVSWGFLGSNQV